MIQEKKNLKNYQLKWIINHDLISYQKIEKRNEDNKISQRFKDLEYTQYLNKNQIENGINRKRKRVFILMLYYAYLLYKNLLIASQNL